MKKKPKQKIIDVSINSIFLLLLDACRFPTAYSNNLKFIAALKSQGSLCSLDMEFSVDGVCYSILPLSLNTLKNKTKNNTYEKSLPFLDKLRRQAKKAILETSAPSATTFTKRSKSALEDKIQKQKDSIDQLHAINLVLTQALAINRRDLLTIANTNNNGLRQKRINDAIDRIIKILSLNPEPFNDVAILSMKTHLELVNNEK